MLRRSGFRSMKRSGLIGLVCLILLSGFQAAGGVTPLTPAHAEAPLEAYFSFVINVHHWVQGERSADQILKLIDLFSSRGIRADFYLTADIAYYYHEHRPEVISRLCKSGMTISYHVRPPHPLYSGFDRALSSLSEEALHEALMAAETQRLDLSTGTLIPDQPGGYAFVASLCGRNPVALGVPTREPRVRAAAFQVYRELGAQMVILEHETGAELRQVDGLWTRPSDFSITRWKTRNSDAEEIFWWNMVGTARTAEFDPISHLQEELAAWKASHNRPAYITALIHEQDFFYHGENPWDVIFYEVRGERRTVRTPPYDLSLIGADTGIRSQSTIDAIWAEYVALVDYVVSQPGIRVVTSADIVAAQK